MENFNFGEIPVHINNNYLDIERARKSRENRSSKKNLVSTIECLSSLYKEASKAFSPENRGKLNTLLISLAITLLSSDMNNQALKEELSIKTISDTAYSFKLEESPSSELQETKTDSLPLKIKNEPSSKIRVETSSPSEKEPESKQVDNLHHFPKPENLPPTSTQSPEKVSERVQTYVDELQVIAAVLTKNEKLYPREMFTEELSIAQKIVESGLKTDAESDKGSVGETQVQPITMKEAIRYANILSRAGDIQTSLPDEKNITEKDISEMVTLVKSNGYYANAFKDIYLINLLNNHRIGKKEFARGDVDGALKKDLVAYNWNPTDFKKYENQESVWPPESKGYYKKIFHYRDLIIKIKAQMGDMQILTDFSVLSPILAMEVNKYERELSSHDKNSGNVIKKIIRGYLDVILEMEKIKEKPLNDEEVQRLVDKFNNRIYRDYQNYLAQGTDFENSAFEL